MRPVAHELVATGAGVTPPLVSVVVPAFNAMPWLAETLPSVCGQTLSDIEVIVVDDGSTDDTAAYVQACGQRDRRVRCLTQANAGIACARNAGAAAATGRYITFLDADDLWAPVKLERQVRMLADRPGSVALTGLRRFVVEAGSQRWLFETIPPAGAGPDYLRKLLALRSTEMVGIATGLAPRDEWRALGGYDPSLASAEDWDMWLRMARTFEFLTVPGEPLQFYRKRAGSVTTLSNPDRDFGAWRTVLLKQRALGGVSDGVVRNAIAARRFECAEIHRHIGHKWSALRNLLLSTADPGLLLRREFYTACVRLMRSV